MEFDSPALRNAFISDLLYPPVNVIRPENGLPALSRQNQSIELLFMCQRDNHPCGEADFCTALLTKGVSSFGRNDDSLDGEKKNRQTATAKAKAKCGDSSLCSV